MSEKNQLYYGDNLDVLRRYVRDETVDLIYLDPPFNSRQEYSVLFAEKDGSRSSSQVRAFEDTWEWNLDSRQAYEEIVEAGGRVACSLIYCGNHFAPHPRNGEAIRSCLLKC